MKIPVATDEIAIVSVWKGEDDEYISQRAQLSLFFLEVDYSKLSTRTNITKTIPNTMPVTQFKHPDPYKYQNGFDSYHEYAMKPQKGDM